MENKQIKISFWKAIIIVVIVLLVVGATLWFTIKRPKENKNYKIAQNGKIDDWEYDPNKAEYNNKQYNSIAGGNTFTSSVNSAGAMDSASNIGLSTGGAKDVNNFRENIKNGYFPISTDITYNGLFYDYTFNTGNENNESQELFSPSYSCAISKDPFSNNEEYYMTVGLNSNIKESDFSRKKLNLVVVLDISGSMESSFNSYYYDNNYKNKEENKSKMEIANESVNLLIDQLKEDDRFGMVLFDDSAYLAKPINLVSETNMDAIKEHVLDIYAMGGTNFEAGYKKATELFEEYKNVDSEEYENRIIVITDAMPNYGTTSKNGLLSYVEENTDDKIYTTFIGVGVDFNTELIEEISDVKGANYYAVHNSKEFKERLGEQFEYMVTPLVFDLVLNLESEDYEIEAVYGTDTSKNEKGNLMQVNTLFPSKTTSDGEVKGGVVLLKLKKTTENNNGKINLKVSYKDRTGNPYSNSQTVSFNEKEEFYANTGIRKAILLTRYVNTLKNWILYERSENDKFLIVDEAGIKDCLITEPEIIKILGENERTSVNLTVSDEYKRIFDHLITYIEKENKEIKDETLNQEIEILRNLAK